MNALMQILLLGCQLANQYCDFVQPANKVLILLILGFIQGAIGIVAHSYNTDGTTQLTAYRPPSTSSRPMLIKGLLFLLLPAPILGCSIDPAVFEALAKDNATFCARITTIYGTMTVSRTNIVNGDVKCDALEVHSPGSTVVPVRVEPVSP
jgi:hypothetical protein